MVMSMAVTLAAARGPRFSIPDRSGHLFRHARRHPRRRARRVAPVGAGRCWGGTPTSSVKRVLKVSSDEQLTAEQTSPRRTVAGHRPEYAGGELQWVAWPPIDRRPRMSGMTGVARCERVIGRCRAG